ncbi:PTS system mannose/fructose/N-acetylgalactosamine-transporter subunit IIB [candidate division KSB1 bacterium]
MSLTLVRIDDRLVHGQVTVGWGSFLNPDRILLVSDEIAQDEWQKELYQNCVPFDIKISILSVEEAANTLKSGKFDKDRIILLVESPSVLVDLVKNNVVFQQVNIGGMHFKPNKKKLLSYVFVDNVDVKAFKFLEESNIELVCQELPQAKKENLISLIENIQ